MNARGTLNVLEAARRSGKRAVCAVHFDEQGLWVAAGSCRLRMDGTRYRAADPGFRGVNETQPLDFHSPYGCSKGAADQYVRDYARIYGLPTVVFRMSCIAGPRQLGNEDQGWVAHFLYSVLRAQADHDLRRRVPGARRAACARSDGCDAGGVREAATARAAQVYNLGGGHGARGLSDGDAATRLRRMTGEPLRAALQRRCVRAISRCTSRTRRSCRAHTGWKARREPGATTLESILEFWNAEPCETRREASGAELAPALRRRRWHEVCTGQSAMEL